MENFYDLELGINDRLTVAMVTALEEVYIYERAYNNIYFCDTSRLSWAGDKHGRCIFEYNRGEGLIELSH